MSFEVLYWHWFVLGVVLMFVEMVIPTFTALWFGAAALVVSLVLWLLPATSLATQIMLWSILSIVLTWLWFKYLKPLSVDKTMAGLSREAMLGQIGQVLSLPQEHKRGMLRFPAPVLGSDEWQFITQDTLALGDRVRVTEISGNSLIVVKH